MAMLYTPQQLAGGSSYTRGVRVGNWFEDIEYQDTKLKDFLAKRKAGTLASSSAAERVSLLSAQVPHSFSVDGKLLYGDTIQIESCAVGGTVEGNLFQRLTPTDSQVAVSRKPRLASASTTLVVSLDSESSAAGRNASDKVLCYGDLFFLCSNPSLRVDPVTNMRRPPLYLTSRKNSFSTKLSGPQACCMSLERSRDARWVVVPRDIKRAVMFAGQPVEADKPVLLQHVSSSNYLGCSESFEDGKKFALICKSFKANKSRTCDKLTAENEFLFVTATDKAAAVDRRVFVDMTAGAILAKIKARVDSRGSYGMRGLSRVFSKMDDSGDGVLDREDFMFGLKDYLGGEVSNEELNMVLREFDSNGDGLISSTEFIRTIRPPLSARRTGLIMQAFAILDKAGTGVVTVETLKSTFDVSRLPEVLAGDKSQATALGEFLAQWDKSGSGSVSKAEWMEYYTDVSASIDSEDYFELVMRNAWHISGGSGQYENTTCRRVLVTLADGSQTVQEIKDDIGIGADDKDAMLANLAAQGIVGVKDIEFYGEGGA